MSKQRDEHLLSIHGKGNPSVLSKGLLLRMWENFTT
jgi:hypothetical protein